MLWPWAKSGPELHQRRLLSERPSERGEGGDGQTRLPLVSSFQLQDHTKVAKQNFTSKFKTRLT